MGGKSGYDEKYKKSGYYWGKEASTEKELKINRIEADINNYIFDKQYDVIFSSGLLHYLTPKTKQQRFNHFKEHTNPSGHNAHFVFVDKPFIEKAPDAEENVYFFKSGELMTYYWDWEIIHFKELIFDCNSGGVDHRHAANRIIAKKVR